VKSLDRLNTITKQDIVKFANENFNDNYVVVYKRTGVDPNQQKVVKPEITPVSVNREAESDFVKNILNTKADDFVKNILNTKADEVNPVFINYDKDIKKFKIKSDVDVLYLKNSTNELFNLYYVFDMGSNNNKMINLAVNYLPFLGTSKYSPSELQQEFYKLGCSFSVSSNFDMTFVSLSGLNENFIPALKLFEELLNDPIPNETALNNLVKDIIKRRADAKLQKGSILSAMNSYGPFLL